MTLKTKQIVLWVCLMITGLSLSAQEVIKSDKTEFIGGKYYYLHQVEKGQTVSALSRAYEVSVDEIYEANPDVKKVLKAGSVVKIPAKKPPAQNPTVHTVQKGETLTSIAQLYKVKIEDILKVNPGLSPNNLKIDQQINIPQIAGNSSESVGKVSYKLHVVQKDETLSSISRKYNVSVDELKQHNPGLNETIQIGQQIRVPVKGEEVRTPDKPEDTTTFHCMETGMLANYNVGVLIPFYLERANYIDTSDKDNPLRHYSSFAFIGFYEGFMMAVDTTTSMGLSLNLYVEDVTDDSLKTMNVLQKEGFDQLHLLIGPFFSSSFNYVADWSKEHKIKTVNPYTYQSRFVEENPYIYKNVASCKEQAKQSIDYIMQTWPGCNIILANSCAVADTDMIEAYRAVLQEIDSVGSFSFEVDFGKSGCSGITSHMSPDKINVVLSFIHGEAGVSNYIRNMNESSYKFPLVVFGLKEWDNYQSLESEYLLNIHLHQVTYSFVDYNRNDVKAFVIAYRQRYKTEPDAYAFSGFDIGMYFLNAIRLYGMDFQKCLGEYKWETLSTPFEFIQSAPGQGFENTRLCIIRYEDYQIFNALTQPQTEIEVNKKKN